MADYIQIATPEILVLFSILLAIPAKQHQTVVLQKITAYYLSAVIMNLLSQFYFPILSSDCSVSFGLPMLLVAGVIFISTPKTLKQNADGFIKKYYLAAFAIIISHIVILLFLLKRYYGFGYERNMYTLGAIAANYLLLIFLWPILSSAKVRQFFGIILGLICIIFTVKMRLL